MRKQRKLRMGVLGLVLVGAVILATAWAVLPLFAATPSIQEPIKIDGGMVTGTPAYGWGVREFRGIPYAAPPVGDLRWRPPQALASWKGVLAADHFSPKCMQAGGISSSEINTGAKARGGPATALWDDPGTTEMSENCLYLNLWTPAKSAADKLPVMIWFHGGGLRGGEGSEEIFDGSMMAKKGVIWVTVNYRLNVFGFFAHPELTAESEHHASGNYGLLDMMAAVKWVKNNIAQFGGDPNSITVMGHSGGSRAMVYLMASPLAKGLYQREIAHSHTAFGRMATLAEVESEGATFAHAVGAPNLAALRAMSANDVEAGDQKNRGLLNDGEALVDGWVMPEDAYTIFNSGKQNDVAVLTGVTNDEPGILIDMDRWDGWHAIMRNDPRNDNPPQTVAEYTAWAKKYFGDQADTMLKVYPANSDADVGRDSHDIGRDSNLEGHRYWGQVQSKAGKPFYLYVFSQKPPVPTTPGSQLPVIGAIHGGEFFYTFDNLHLKDLPWTDTDRKVADIASSYWTNFAKTGDPNGPGLPRWNAYNVKDDQLMNIGGTPQMEPAPDKAGLDFLASWDQHFRKFTGKGDEITGKGKASGPTGN